MRIVSLFILTVLVVAAVVIVWKVAAWPGAVAARRGHPQAEAIRWCGWLGLLTGIAWPIAMVWAHLRPTHHGEA
jgi:hypothetical protein